MRFFISRLWLAAAIVLCYTAAQAQQVINAYAEVISASGSAFNLGTVDESWDTFEVGEKIIVIQMQDDVVSDLTNTSGFGDVASIASAGHFETLTVSAVQESGGIPTSISVSSSPVNTYSFNAHSSVQIVSYPNPGGALSYTTTANITAKDWDGTTGGVVAFYAEEKLVLQHDIIADGNGFRGGDELGTSATSDCNSSNYVMPYSNSSYAGKGEGIYNPADDNYSAGRGKIANGGGGGNAHNSGGGGGGNYTAGGTGTHGWQCTGNGGIGGESLSAFYSSGRLFAGGGGGSGEANNNCGTNGGDGGGIIIIEADTLVTTGSNAITITANGESVPPTTGDGNDGAGGGGAGGSILLEVKHFEVGSTAPLTVQANGGKGGDVAHNDTHGAGGGGGQGAVIYVIQEPADVITQTLAGDGGAGDQSTSAPVASSGTGTENDGVIDDTDDTAFPVQWIYYDAKSCAEGVRISWTTASERNNSHFLIYHSNGNESWKQVAEKEGNGNSNQIRTYECLHTKPGQQQNYYKIRQVDHNGQWSETPVFSACRQSATQMLLYPNPANDILQLSFSSKLNGHVEVKTSNGKRIISMPVSETDRLLLNISALPKGIYYLEVINNNNHTKILKKWVKL